MRPRPVHITLCGCLFWALGLLSSVYAICDYWSCHGPSLFPQYYIWYQQTCTWVLIFFGFASLVFAVATGKQLFGVFLYLMAGQGILFGLIQAPAPTQTDICFRLNQQVSLTAHLEDGLGLKTSLIDDIEYAGIKSNCHSSIYPVSNPWQKHVLVEATVESLEGMSVNNIARCLKNRVFSRLHMSRCDDFKKCSKEETVFVQMRICMVERHKLALGATKGALLASIVLGDRVVELPSKVKNDFRRSGVSHLLAASGFNLSIFVTAMCLVLRLLTRHSLVVSVAGIFSVVSFVLLAGPSPSVVRAAIWAVLLLLLKLLDRRVNLIALLFFSMFLHLVIDPFSILDIGWQLSYAATASIICGVENLDSNKSIFSWLRSASTVVLMAQAAVLPLACIYFKQINALFLIVNLMLDPLVAPLTILGFVSSWVGLLSRELGWCLDIIAYFPLGYMLFVTQLFSGLEFSQINIKPPPTWILIVYTTALVYFVVAKQVSKRGFNFASTVFYLSLLLLLLSSICP